MELLHNKFVWIGIPLVLNIILLAAGIIIPTSVGLAKTTLDGSCPLFLKFRYDNTTLIIENNWEKACMGVICTHVVFSVYRVVMVFIYAYMVYHACRGNENKIESMWKTRHVVSADAWGSAAVLIFACLLTWGWYETCDNFNTLFPGDKCFQSSDVTWRIKGFDVTHFIQYMILAEVASWISFGAGLAITAIGSLYYYATKTAVAYNAFDYNRFINA